MTDEQPRTSLWLVGETGYDSFSPHAVFATEADAKAYAEVIHDGVDELPLYGPGEMPEIVDAWSAEATVRRQRRTATTSTTLGNTSVTVYDNEPPTLTRRRFSTLSHVPAWATQPCEVTDCQMVMDDLFIRFHGSDRDAVLAACTARYEAGLDAMGARR